jgi:NDP-sugar pyrophosphorylase family protein
VTGLIIARPAPRLRALAGDGVVQDLCLLDRPLALYQRAFLERQGVGRVILAGAGGAPPKAADVPLVGTHEPELPVLVLDGDILADGDISGLLCLHAEHAPAATIMVRADRRSPEGRTTDGGVYVVEARHLGSLLSTLSTMRPPRFLEALLASGLPCAAWCAAAYSRRIHSPAAYRAAHMDLLDGRATMLVAPPGRAADGSWIGEGVTLGLDATIVPPSVIGAGTELRAGTRVGPRAVIGGQSCLEPGARVAESVLGDGVVVGASATLDGCVVGSGARIAPFSILAPGAVLGRGAVLRSRTVLPR